VSFSQISQERWDAVWAADFDVLRSLSESGDNPEVEREIDVSFRGDFEALSRLAQSSSNFGFSVEQLTDDPSDGAFLLLVRSQQATQDAIRELTETYLQIEDTFGVECDGWGCVAQAS